MYIKNELEYHMNDPATIEYGTYVHPPGSTVFYNPNTNNVVIFDKDGSFLSACKLYSGTIQYNYYISTGKLF
jgi:filamentous hemagglutinin